jgi:hypothetical protein
MARAPIDKVSLTDLEFDRLIRKSPSKLESEDEVKT